MLSIVTALFDKLPLTRAFLESLERHPPDGPWEIIWVDDGSTDGTREWLATLPSPRHRVILNERNLGFAASNNRGAAAAAGETLALLNNDLVLTPGWFAPMAAALASDPTLGVVGNVQLDAATGRVDHAGIYFHLVGLPTHAGKHRRHPPRGDGHFSPAATAACWLIRRDVFLETGGFDEGYRNGGEDIDLCLRLSATGRRHWISHRSVIWHHVGASRGRAVINANNRRFLEKWAHVTVAHGQREWARDYLLRHARQPWRLNGPKTLDALLRLLRLRHGDSAWAAKKRRAILDS